MEVLSEHLCQGWLEGYLLTGRHGLFNCYEAFIHIVDSMFNQHAKWLKVTRDIPWRRPIASLNYLLSSHVWRQDHNGFSHQDPGFIDHVVNKKAEIIRVYLPPDANTLLSVADHCLRSRDYVNVIVAGKQPALNYLSMDDAIVHCTRGVGIWEWASNDDEDGPDVVLGCCGDMPTLETLAAAAILRERLPELKVRVVNVVDLMRLQPESEHPHGLSDSQFDALFTVDRPVVFAYHGYPWLIHRLTYRRANHDNMHVRGYKEEGTTTTPFDMVMLNDLDRFHLVIDVIDRVPGARRARGAHPAGDGGRAAARPRVHARARRGRPGDPRLDLAELGVSSDPRRQRGLDEPQALDRRRRRATRGRSSRSMAAAQVDAVAHRVVHGGARFGDPVVVDAAVRAGLEEVADLAPLHNAQGARCDRRGDEGATRRAARRRLRHGVPPHDAGGGVDVRAAGALARRVGHPPLRVPRALGAVGVRAGARRAARRLPPRRRLLGVGRARRPVGRHDDGLQPARGRADGDALRLDRRRDRPASPADGEARRRGDRARARVGVRAARALRRARTSTS